MSLSAHPLNPRKDHAPTTNNVDAIFYYMLKSSYRWRPLLYNSPPWSTVYYRFGRF